MPVTCIVTQGAVLDSCILEGAVELNVTALIVLNTAKTTPFEIKDGIEANDDTRLRYRYLDL
ncbi:aspartate--tRNA ligase, partial [Streptococcus pneumoniae]